MTRKDYVLLADALRRARRDNVPGQPRMDLSNHNRGVDWCARGIADTLAADNPRFDRQRFLRAAGVQ
jgi:hypothetical protein